MNVVIIIAGSLFIYWIYKCIVVVKEGWHKNIAGYDGSYLRTLSSVENLRVDDNGKLVVATKKRGLRWIWYGFEYVDGYWFSWAQAMSTVRVPKNKTQNLIWGDLQTDAEVTYQRYEWTTGHKHQDTYQFRINELETGEESGDENKDSAENVTIHGLVSATVTMVNLRDVQYRDGGKVGWYGNLETTIESALGEVVRNTVYANIKDIMGETIESEEVDNIEPTEERAASGDDPGYTFIFKDENGKRKEKITFLERINYVLLDRDRIGIKVSRITLQAVEVSDESKEYIKALELKAISIQNLATAENNANAMDKFLDKKTKRGIEIIKANKDAIKEIKQTEDVTVVKKAEAQTNLRVLVEEQSGGTKAMGFDSTRVFESVMAFDIAKEIDHAQKEKPDQNKKPSQDSKKQGGEK